MNRPMPSFSGNYIKGILYSICSYTYYIFMERHSPLGISWRPHHIDRVLNATNHISNGSLLSKYGLTSFDRTLEYVSQKDSLQTISTYLVSSITFLPHVLIEKLRISTELLNYGPIRF